MPVKKTPAAGPVPVKKKKNRNTGLDFEAEVLAGGRAIGAHIYKIATNRWAQWASKSIYDVFAVHCGVPVAIECKSLATQGAFPFSRVDDHQLHALLHMESCGGSAYILIGVRGRPLRAWALKASEFAALKEEYAGKGRKSIPFSAFSSLPELSRVQGSPKCAWDLTPLFLP